MPQKTENPYQNAELSVYPLKQQVLIRLADWTFYLLIKFVGKTIKYEVEGSKFLERLETDGEIPVYATWHNRIFPSVYFLRNRKIVVLTSQSFDGEYIARFIQRFGFGAVRGSSTRGGIGGLAAMIRLMKKKHPMCFTVDGPKGPRYSAKSGAILLAKKTQNPVLPFVIETEKFWTINSWDKLQIPKPFTRAKVFFGEPVYVSKKADDREIETKLRELQSKLDELVVCGKQWHDT